MDINLMFKIGLIVLSSVEFLVLILLRLKDVKNKENLNIEFEELKKEYEEYQSLITSIVPEAIEVAEKCGLNTKELKHLVAINKIREDCFKDDVDYEKFAKTAEDFIERLIAFSKKVNVIKRSRFEDKIEQ